MKDFKIMLSLFVVHEVLCRKEANKKTQNIPQSMRKLLSILF